MLMILLFEGDFDDGDCGYMLLMTRERDYNECTFFVSYKTYERSREFYSFIWSIRFDSNFIIY